MAAGPADIGDSWGREASHEAAVGARLERAVNAAHSLSHVVWEELHEQLSRSARGAPAPRSAALAERIAEVASTVALLARPRDEDAPAPDGARAPTTHAPAASSPATRAALIDEHDEVPTDELRAARTRRAGDALDARARAGRPGWVSLIESALVQFEREQVSFAVLLVEVLDGAEPAGAEVEVGATIARALDAIRPASVSPEDSRRYWLLMPLADRLGARSVADRLALALGPVDDDSERADATDTYFAALSARASRPPAALAATPLRIAAGAAACPEDGRDLPALVARAHIELAEARSASGPFVALTEPEPR